MTDISWILSEPTERVDAVPAFKQLWLRIEETPTLKEVSMDGDTLCMEALFDRVEDSASDEEIASTIAEDVAVLFDVFKEVVLMDVVETPDRFEVVQCTSHGETWSWCVSAAEARQYDAGEVSTDEVLDRVDEAIEEAGYASWES
jgi:hypothetical protein